MVIQHLCFILIYSKNLESKNKLFFFYQLHTQWLIIYCCCCVWKNWQRKWSFMDGRRLYFRNWESADWNSMKGEITEESDIRQNRKNILANINDWVRKLRIFQILDPNKMLGRFHEIVPKVKCTISLSKFHLFKSQGTSIWKFLNNWIPNKTLKLY